MKKFLSAATGYSPHAAHNINRFSAESHQKAVPDDTGQSPHMRSENSQ